MIAEIATTAAAIYGIYVAHMGLRTWRREAIGKRDVTLCEEVMAGLYEAQSRLKELRSPLVFAGEGSSRPDRDDEGDERRRRDTLFAPIERLEAQLPFWRTLLSHRFKMKAFVTGDTSRLFDRLNKLLGSYRAAAVTRFQSEFPNKGALNADTLKAFDAVLFEIGDNDPTRQELDDIVRDMEAICLPYVREKRLSFATPIEWLGTFIWQKRA